MNGARRSYPRCRPICLRVCRPLLLFHHKRRKSYRLLDPNLGAIVPLESQAWLLLSLRPRIFARTNSRLSDGFAGVTLTRRPAGSPNRRKAGSAMPSSSAPTRVVSLVMSNVARSDFESRRNSTRLNPRNTSGRNARECRDMIATFSRPVSILIRRIFNSGRALSPAFIQSSPLVECCSTSDNVSLRDRSAAPLRWVKAGPPQTGHHLTSARHCGRAMWPPSPPKESAGAREAVLQDQPMMGCISLGLPSASCIRFGCTSSSISRSGAGDRSERSYLWITNRQKPSRNIEVGGMDLQTLTLYESANPRKGHQIFNRLDD